MVPLEVCSSMCSKPSGTRFSADNFDPRIAQQGPFCSYSGLMSPMTVGSVVIKKPRFFAYRTRSDRVEPDVPTLVRLLKATICMAEPGNVGVFDVDCGNKRYCPSFPYLNQN